MMSPLFLTNEELVQLAAVVDNSLTELEIVLIDRLRSALDEVDVLTGELQVLQDAEPDSLEALSRGADT